MAIYNCNGLISNGVRLSTSMVCLLKNARIFYIHPPPPFFWLPSKIRLIQTQFIVFLNLALCRDYGMVGWDRAQSWAHFSVIVNYGLIERKYWNWKRSRTTFQRPQSTDILIFSANSFDGQFKWHRSLSSGEIPFKLRTNHESDEKAHISIWYFPRIQSAGTFSVFKNVPFRLRFLPGRKKDSGFWLGTGISRRTWKHVRGYFPDGVKSCGSPPAVPGTESRPAACIRRCWHGWNAPFRTYPAWAGSVPEAGPSPFWIQG